MEPLEGQNWSVASASSPNPKGSGVYWNKRRTDTSVPRKFLTTEYPSGAEPMTTQTSKNELAVRSAIATLLKRAELVQQALHRARLSPKPTDLTSLVMEALADITRSLAFLLDESLASSGRSREIHFKPVERGNGNGNRDVSRLVVP